MTAILGLLLSLSAPLFPVAAASPADLGRHFEAFFESPELNSRFCGRNIDAFIAYLKRENALPADLRRVVIRTAGESFHPAHMLIATNVRFADARRGEPRVQFWDFHVVAVSGGLVYDFSFDVEPRVLPIAEYVEAMFVPSEPYPVFGQSYRIRGQGPNYTPEYARRVIQDLSFEIERPTVGGRTEKEAELGSLEAMLDWSLR